MPETSFDQSQIYLLSYNEDEYHEEQIQEIGFPVQDDSRVSWLHAKGMRQDTLAQQLRNMFDVHPLLLENITDIGQRPKVEDFGDYMFLALRTMDFDERTEEVRGEQVYVIISENFVISLQDGHHPIFRSIRHRLKHKKGLIRKQGTDYLAYTLVDSVVDHYFLVLEQLRQKIESIEDQLLEEPTPETLEKIHGLKRQVLAMRRYVWPLRDVIRVLQKGQSHLIDESTLLFFRDVYDHAAQVIDTIAAFQAILTSMLDIYVSNMSNRMNEIMKILAMISTIFIPLTYICSVYGMNFDYMPELKWRWGYPMVLGIAASIVIGMFVYFKKKKWI